MDELFEIQKPRAIKLEKHLTKNLKHDWQWLKDKNILRPAPTGVKKRLKDDAARRRPPPAPPDDPDPQVVIREREVCEMCDAVDSFIKVSGIREHPSFGQVYARCKHCGHKAHIRHVHMR